MKAFRNLAGTINRQTGKAGKKPNRKRLLLKTMGYRSREQRRF
jgi:hypothetical protein